MRLYPAIFFLAVLFFLFTTISSTVEGTGFLIGKKAQVKEAETETSQSRFSEKTTQVTATDFPEPIKIKKDGGFLEDYGGEQEIKRLRKIIEKHKREVKSLQGLLGKEQRKSKELETQLLYFKEHQQRLYEVKKGESLWKISAKRDVYNNPQLWIKIFNANIDRIEDPNLIFPGQMFVIPE